MDSQQVFQRFQTLHPPFDSATAFRALGDAYWARHTKFYDPKFISGFWPLHGDFLNAPGGTATVAYLRAGGRIDAGWVIYLHFHSTITARLQREQEQTGAPFPPWWQAPYGEGHGRRFFQGQVSSDIQVDEYSLCYPDGHILNVTPEARKITPPDIHQL